MLCQLWLSSLEFHLWLLPPYDIPWDVQVRQIAAAWRQEDNAKATAASGLHGPQRAVATRMRTSVRVDQQSRGAGPSALCMHM